MRIFFLIYSLIIQYYPNFWQKNTASIIENANGIDNYSSSYLAFLIASKVSSKLITSTDSSGATSCP